MNILEIWLKNAMHYISKKKKKKMEMHIFFLNLWNAYQLKSVF